MSGELLDRRAFVKTVAASATVVALAGCAGNEDNGNGVDPGNGGGEDEDGDGNGNGDQPPEPDYGDWFDDVENYDGTADLRGEDTVDVAVGAGSDGLLFDPAAIRVDPGTTVVFEWTGEGGGHNVAEVDDVFESETVDEAGHTFEYTFEDEGVFQYECTPHVALGMKGAVVVGDD